MSKVTTGEREGRQKSEETYLRIGEVAERTGLTQRTIRYYEERGLLPPPSRTQGDFRLFSETDLKRLDDIVRLKSLLGFSLSEIKEIVEGEEALGQIRSEYHATDNVATRLLKLDEAGKLTRNQLALLERKLGQMLEMRCELEARLARYETRIGELRQQLSEVVEL